MHQIITITGRLTRDPESNTYGEKTVCRFAVAVDDGYGDKKLLISLMYLFGENG
ncbi:hypothetical protein AAHB59_13080 [Bacillus cereus]